MSIKSSVLKALFVELHVVSLCLDYYHAEISTPINDLSYC